MSISLYPFKRIDINKTYSELKTTEFKLLEAADVSALLVPGFKWTDIGYNVYISNYPQFGVSGRIDYFKDGVFSLHNETINTTVNYYLDVCYISGNLALRLNLRDGALYLTVDASDMSVSGSVPILKNISLYVRTGWNDVAKDK